MSFNAFLLWLLLVVTPTQASVRLLGGFDADWRAGWETQQLGGRETIYEVVEEDGDRVLRADADAAATALYRIVEGPGIPTEGEGRERFADLSTQVSWRWKVQASLAGNPGERTRSGDDYAARIFVIFGDGRLRPGTPVLSYVWAGDQPVGSSYPSPVVDSVMTIVLQSGDDHAGSWKSEQRDVAADYRRAFGRPAPDVRAIALLVDTDDTGRRATAWFDEIVLRYPSAPSPWPGHSRHRRRTHFARGSR